VNEVALRLSRGLFRLWLVLSAFWIAGTVAHTWQTIPTTIETAASNNNTGAGWSAKYAKPPSGSESTTSHPTRPADDWSEVSTPLSDQSNPFAEYASSTSTTPRDTLLVAAQIAFIPPIIVLAIGSSLGWAFKGFR
jgi:hypothetical protein